MYATLFLPCFRLQSALRSTPSPRSRSEPVALLDSRGGRSTILEASTTALQRGVSTGMSPSQALARCPDLQFLPPCQESEIKTCDLLRQVAWTLSPKVESIDPAFCTIDLRGSGPNPKPLLVDAVQTLEKLHLNAKAGIACTPELSRLAAHYGNPVLCIENDAAFAASLPLSAITQESHLLETLGHWGIHTAGALLQLPKQPTLDRLGVPGRALWKAASARVARPLDCAHEPELFEESLFFEREMETLEPLLFVLNRLLQSLLSRITDSARLVAGMELALPLENRATYLRAFHVPAPTLEAPVLLGILQTHLEQLHLEHRPVGARLRLQPTAETSWSLDLFDPTIRDPNRFGETLAKLYALLGEARVGIPEPTDSHLPDSCRMKDPAALYKQAPPPRGEESLPFKGLPLHRLRPAPPVDIEFTRLKPAFIRSEPVSGKIVASQGPYRLSTDWWHPTDRSIETWDILVLFQEPTRRGQALARIGGLLEPRFKSNSTPQSWRLEGFYDIQRETR